MKRFALSLMVTAAALAAGCGGSSGPGGTDLSQSDALSLSQALATSGALTSGTAGFAPFVLQQVRRVGTMTAGQAAPLRQGHRPGLSFSSTPVSSFDAVGISVSYTYGTITGYWVGVVGWAGFNSSAHTVDEVVTATVFNSLAGAFPGTGTYAFDNTDQFGYATYWTRSPEVLYLASTGSLTLTTIEFSGGGTNCGGTYGGVTVTCSYTTGTMSGNFAFTGSAEGGGTWDQSNTTFTLPAVQLTINIPTGTL